MTIKKAFWLIALVLVFHFVGLVFDLYGVFEWYDIPMHGAGGLAIGALGIGIWNEGIHDVKFKGWFQKHLTWWLVPGIVIGFVSFVGVVWELHEYVLDQIFPMTVEQLGRQPGIGDTMMDLTMDLLGAVVSLFAFWKR